MVNQAQKIKLSSKYENFTVYYLSMTFYCSIKHLRGNDQLFSCPGIPKNVFLFVKRYSIIYTLICH